MTNGKVPTRLLVIGMADQDGVLMASTLFATGRACGLAEEQVRSCLRRMMGEELLDREGRGKRARYMFTERGWQELRLQRDRARWAFTQDAFAGSSRSWDGLWRTIGFEVPERLRAQRDEFRALLGGLGSAVLQSGVYVTPRPVNDAVDEAATRLGLTEFVFRATVEEFSVRGITDPRKITRTLWPIASLAERYTGFVDQCRPVVQRLRDLEAQDQRIADERLLPGTLRMASRFLDVHEHDPLLPPELLPDPWPGREARTLVTKRTRLRWDFAPADAR